LSLLDLVALGTVADVARLEGLNRAFVAKGLLAMRRRERPGLTALMDVARLMGPPEPWHLGFLLGPRINAGGRIGKAELGTRLLLEEDATQAAALALELDRLNAERQVIEQSTLAQAEAEAEAALGANQNAAVIVTAAPGWHPGVLGLVAARLKEKFGRPALAIALDAGGTGTGSGRSIVGVDLGRAVRRAVAQGILVKGGGHPMAAGVTLEAGRLAAFRAYLEAELGPAVEAARRDDALLIDGALSAAGAGTELCETIARAGPFGAGNPEPIFALPSHLLVHAEQVGQGHIRARLKSGDGSAIPAIAFRATGQPLGQALLESRGRTLHAAGCLAVDRWQGTDRIQFRIVDLAFNGAGAQP
jgi:single-stranded-DNA-specific exonuclease